MSILWTWYVYAHIHIADASYIVQVHVILPFIYTGSSLSKCTFNGQQCCSKTLVTLVDQGFRSLVQSDQFNFTGGLAGAQSAIDQMWDRTNGMYIKLINIYSVVAHLFCL